MLPRPARANPSRPGSTGRGGAGVRAVPGESDARSVTFSRLSGVPAPGSPVLPEAAAPVSADATWAAVASGCPAR